MAFFCDWLMSTRQRAQIRPSLSHEIIKHTPPAARDQLSRLDAFVCDGVRGQDVCSDHPYHWKRWYVATAHA